MVRAFIRLDWATYWHSLKTTQLGVRQHTFNCQHLRGQRGALDSQDYVERTRLKKKKKKTHNIFSDVLLQPSSILVLDCLG